MLLGPAAADRHDSTCNVTFMESADTVVARLRGRMLPPLQWSELRTYQADHVLGPVVGNRDAERNLVEADVANLRHEAHVAAQRHAAAAGGAGAADGGERQQRRSPQARQKRSLRDPEVRVPLPAGAGRMQLLQMMNIRTRVSVLSLCSLLGRKLLRTI